MNRKFSNFVELLQYRSLEQPSQPVFTFLADGEIESASLTYAELDRHARAIAARLQLLQVAGERALLLYPPGLDFIAAFLGCLYAGVIPVPAYPPRANRSLERLQAIVADADAKLALTTDSLVESIAGKLTLSLSRESLRCITTDTLPLTLADDWREYRPDGDRLAFLQYTSGSTGVPKGVMVSHANLIHNSGAINRCFGDTPESIGVSWLPPYHDMGLIGGILQPVYVGARMVLMPPVAFLQRPYRWLKAISDYQATTSGAPNFAYDLCVSQIDAEQRETLDLSRWTLAFTGAEPVRSKTLLNFAETFAPNGFKPESFYPCYGMAETTLIVSGGIKENPPVMASFDSRGIEENRVIPATGEESVTFVGCGRAIEGTLKVVDPDTLEIRPENEIGEIWVKSPSVAMGYWNRSTLTEAMFNARAGNEGPFLRTGDLGFLQDGELFITGRLKDLIIIRGRNHYPQDIELTVESSHPAIREGCGAAFAVEIDGEERLIIAYEVKRSYLRKLDTEEVARAVRVAVLQNHELLPYRVVLLKTGSIPKTSSGKIQRHACKAEYLEGSLHSIGEDRGVTVSEPVPVAVERENRQQGSIESWLRENIARRLGISPRSIDPREPLASYGLDSLSVIRLSAELEDWLGRKLSPTLAYDYPTIEALSAYLSGEETVNAVEPTIPAGEQSIAIVGIGCRFPDADNPGEFWRLLAGGMDAVAESNGRWVQKGYGGFLTDIDRFDADFFGISRREAIEIDPQQRLLLEVTYSALENGGINPETLAGSQTGVFIGISSSDYSQIRLQKALETNPYIGTGNAHSIAANRLSYWFDLRGPSLAIDTACSSSLVAVHLAARSLQSGECERAIVGGVNLLLSEELTETFTKAGMMAADGRCKTFDAAADGYVRGEGCGVVILKRLSSAERDGDPILAVIRGTAINQDGRSNGLTAPNGLAQQSVIRQALRNAGVEPSAISYVETHGTGTALGDPIEVNSLKAVLSVDRDRPLMLGSLKTNIGHLEAAAGIAGLIKVVLSLQNEQIPPHLHLKTINPHIDLQDSSIEIPTRLQSWDTAENPRIAGVSSFGFGGTNAHVIVEGRRQEAEGRRQEIGEDRPLHILTLSAKNETAFGELVTAYKNYLTNNLTRELADIAFTANTGRSSFSRRLAVIAGDSRDLLTKLNEISEYKTVDPELDKRVAFLFTGQGSQYAGMGRELYRTQPTFREAIDHCATILQSELEIPLVEVLFDRSDCIHETLYTQPTIFAIEYALARLWMSWGIVPSVVMGHSVGEYVAATIAGVFSVEDGLKLITRRARLMQSLPRTGEMVAVFATEGVIRKAVEAYRDSVSIAAFNGQHLVISGETEALDKILDFCKDKTVKTKKLKVSHAFHSPLMRPIEEDFRKFAGEVSYQAPKIDLISNVTGKIIGEEIANPEYWVNHILAPVRFSDSIETLQGQRYRIFLEIGAKPILSGMGKAISESGYWLTGLREDSDDWTQILDSLAKLYGLGVSIDWRGFDRDYPRTRLAGLPTYPFQRQRYWFTEESHRDWLYGEIWEKETFIPSSRPESIYLVFAGTDSLSEELENRLPGSYFVYAGDSYRKLERGWIINPASKDDYRRLFSDINSLDGILYLWGLENSPIETADFGCRGVLYLLQSLVATAITARLWIVTRGVQKVIESDRVTNPVAATLWGMGKSIALEYTEYWGGIIDLDENRSEEVNFLLSRIANPDAEKQIAFRGGQSYTPRIQRVQQKAIQSKIDYSRGTYLITGGFGQLGLETAGWLASRGVTSLVLLGRKDPPEATRETLETLRQRGITVTVARGDVANREDLQTVLDNVRNNLPPLKGIFHLAGVLDDGLLQGLNWLQFERVFRPKVLGTWNLHELTREMNLDSFVMFSSAASLLGSPGQGNYAAANAFLDSIAYYRHSLGLPALTVNWGTLDGGMAARTRIAVKGLNPLPVAESLKLIDEIPENTARIGIIDIDWDAVRQQFPELVNSPYFARILAPEVKKSQEIGVFDRILQLPDGEREGYILHYLRSAIARVIGLPTEKINAEDSLLDLGMDSLMVMEAINRLKTDLQLMLYPREIYQHPKIGNLAKYLAGEFARTHRGGESIPVPETPLSVGNYQISAGNFQVEKKLPPIAFILSSPRSGSTLLRVMLAGHPDLASPPELHLLPFDTMGQREQDLSLSHLGEGLQRAIMDLKGVDSETGQAILDEWKRQDLSIPEIYANLQTFAGSRLLIDKSPTYAFHRETLDRAETIFDNAKYIHLVRHPHAVIDSFCRLRMDKLVGNGTEDPYQLAELIWARGNQNILDFLAGIDPERHHLIVYEELVTNPEPVTRRLCEFLGIPFHESLLTPYEGQRMTDGVHRQSLSVGDPNFLKRKTIDAKLAESWKEIQLPRPLGEFSRQVASIFDYSLPEEKPVETPSLAEMEETYINVRGLNLCLCNWGEKAGKILFCLHGILEQGATWHEVAIRLARQGYRVIAPDLRGHGKSDHITQGGSYHLLDFLGDIDAIVSQIAEEPITLIGHSFGSVLAAIYASIRPWKVEKLVLVETVIPAEMRASETVNQLTTHLDYLASPPEHPVFPDIATVAGRMRQSAPNLSESLALELAERNTEPCKGGVRWRWANRLRTRAGIEFNGIDKNRYLCILKEIRSSIALIYGDKSQFNRPEDLAEQQSAMPTATRAVVAGGHNLPLENPEEVARIIRQFAG
ncbi:hybrid fatty acyl-AMP ligase/type I polyketide synthase [Pannus brasiliensis CCIBt3594]|uniref:Hybrid fatty acyl-AMP ligase/type I polyketide synthase n=1 Tax=Pannus brasiliensis CCIBt3594 TaxID=1427578 RepID=A0AAW9QNN9_9CHRO